MQRRYGNMPTFWDLIGAPADDPCWIWQGAYAGNGYGKFTLDGKRWSAHRLMYTLTRGPIPDGLLVDHTCHVRACVNPRHLRCVTAEINMQNLRGPSARSTTGVRNVYRSGNKYRVQLRADSKLYYAGTFDTLDEAERVAIQQRAMHMAHNTLPRSESA